MHWIKSSTTKRIPSESGLNVKTRGPTPFISLIMLSGIICAVCLRSAHGDSGGGLQQVDDVIRLYNSGVGLSSREKDWLDQYKSTSFDKSLNEKNRIIKKVSKQFNKTYPDETIGSIKFVIEEWIDPDDDFKSLKTYILVTIFHSNVKLGLNSVPFAKGYIVRGDGELLEVGS